VETVRGGRAAEAEATKIGRGRREMTSNTKATLSTISDYFLHSLHIERTRSCSQIPDPPHSLHL